MGDSGITLQLSLLAVLLVGTGIVAFVAACRVRNGVVRAVAGLLLLAIAVLSSMLSIMGDVGARRARIRRPGTGRQDLMGQRAEIRVTPD